MTEIQYPNFLNQGKGQWSEKQSGKRDPGTERGSNQKHEKKLAAKVSTMIAKQYKKKNGKKTCDSKLRGGEQGPLTWAKSKKIGPLFQLSSEDLSAEGRVSASMQERNFQKKKKG